MKSTESDYRGLTKEVRKSIQDLERYVLGHPLALENETLRDFIDTAHNNLISAYNLIGVLETYNRELSKLKK